jgi:hypothetical protein
VSRRLGSIKNARASGPLLCRLDGEDTYIGALMQHVELAGVHSGDSACVLPAPSLTATQENEISDTVRAIAKELGVVAQTPCGAGAACAIRADEDEARGVTDFERAELHRRSCEARGPLGEASRPDRQTLARKPS